VPLYGDGNSSSEAAQKIGDSQLSYGLPEVPEVPDDLFECAIHLRNNIVGLTTEGGSDAEYSLARSKLMADPASKRMLPDFVRFIDLDLVPLHAVDDDPLH
jgi:hypothetical protein